MAPQRRPHSAAALHSLVAPTWAPLDTLAALSGPRGAPEPEGDAGGAQAVLSDLAGADDLLLLHRLEEAFLARPASATALPERRRRADAPRSPPPPPARHTSAPSLSPLARPKSATSVAVRRPLGGAAGATWPERQPPGAAATTWPGRGGAAPLTQAAANGATLHEKTLWAYSSPCFASKKWAPSRRLPSPRSRPPATGPPVEDAPPRLEEEALALRAQELATQRAAPSPLRSRRARAGQWEEYALGSPLKRGQALPRRSPFRLRPVAARRGGAARPRAAEAACQAATWPEARPAGSPAPAAGRTPASSPSSGGAGGLERTLFPVQALPSTPRAARRCSLALDGGAPRASDAGAADGVGRRFTVDLAPSREGSLAGSPTKRGRPWREDPGGTTPSGGPGGKAAINARRNSLVKDELSPKAQCTTPGAATKSPQRTPGHGSAGKSTHFPPEVPMDPSDPEAISIKVKRMLSADRLNSVFHRFKKDGEVHKDALAPALTFIGYHPVAEWINEVAEKVSAYTTVDIREFRSIVEQYQERRLIEQRKAFNASDKDGSGTIDMAEMSDILKQLGMKPMDFVIQGIFDEVDEDRNGFIDVDEFDEFWMIIESREGFSRVEYNRLMGAFDLFDWDHSGTLDLDETAKVLHYLHYTCSHKEAERIFRSVDVSNLGQLTKREFLLFMRKIRELEVAKITECLDEVFDYTKEGIFTKLLMTLGHVADRQAVLQCAEDAGIDLTDKPATSSSPSKMSRRQSPSPRRNSDEREYRAPVRTSISRLKGAMVAAVTEECENSRRKRNSIGNCMMTMAVTDPTHGARGTAASPVVTSGEAWKFLELYRCREGLTRQELQMNKEAFATALGSEVDVLLEDDDSIELTYHQTWKALRWLGWRIPKEVQQQLIASVDLDNSGCLNLKEFHKLVRLVREREDEEMHRARQAMDLPMASMFEVVHTCLAQRLLVEMGFSEGVDIRNVLRVLGIRPEQGAAVHIGPRSFRFSMKSEERLDWFNVIRVVRYLRAEERAELRKLNGFSQEEVDRLTAIFNQCAYKKVVVTDDGNKELQSSTLRPEVFLSLLDNDYAPALFHGADLRDVKERLVAAFPRALGAVDAGRASAERLQDKTGMDLEAFLQMMNHVHEDADLRYHRKLQRAEENCGFSAQEVREFRTIFVKWDTREVGVLPFDQLVEIVNGLTPLKAIHITELYAVWEEAVSTLDAESTATSISSAADRREPPPKLAHYSRLAAYEPGSTDFPEFLCIMERLLAMDFHNIKSNTQAAAAKREKEDAERKAASQRTTVFHGPTRNSEA